MPLICYEDKVFNDQHTLIIQHANRMIAEAKEDGYALTQRRLYYMFVARGLLDDLGFAKDASGSTNNERSYKKILNVVNDGRLAGKIDWLGVEDMTRHLRSLQTWKDPADRIQAAARTYRTDKWASQDYRPEVWIEKDAVASIVEGICDELEIPWFSCRGYVSQSEMWSAGRRMKAIHANGQQPIVFHFGDHDPSGIQMTEDIKRRLNDFSGGISRVRRLALSMDQIEEHEPPPNPAKVTDSRAAAYIEEYGAESWELDALPPSVIVDLIQEAVSDVRDPERWDAEVEQQEEERAKLTKLGVVWEAVSKKLDSMK